MPWFVFALFLTTQNAVSDSEIRAVFSQFDESWNKGDSDHLASLFTAEADQLLAGGGFRSGREALRTGYGVLRKGGLYHNTKHQTVIHNLRYLTPDTVSVDAETTITGLSDGPRAVRKNWTTYVLTKAQDQWRIAVSRTIAPTPPGPTLGDPYAPELRFLDHPDDPSRRIEFYISWPRTSEPVPVLILVHGHQEGSRTGAVVYFEYLRRFARKGILTVSVSQPGYGRSDGPPDYCGPFTQRAVRAVIDELKRDPRVRKDRIGLMGYSRGAIVAGMVAAQTPGLSAVVLGGGVYDFASAYKTMDPAIRQNIMSEAGTSTDAFNARSLIANANRITAPLLMLHGEEDDRDSVANARRFADVLKQRGADVRLVTFPKIGHGIPPAMLDPEVEGFLASRLLTMR